MRGDPVSHLVEEDSSQREEQRQQPWGRSVLEEQPRGQGRCSLVRRLRVVRREVSEVARG